MTAKPKRPGAGETAARLLDAAEQLFGEHGYNGVGMRMLAQQAGVNLAAATYHFGSKKALYLETFMRRFRAVNAERQRLLDSARSEAGGSAPAVEEVIECLMRPSFLAGLAHPAFNKLLARTLVAPPPFLHTVLRRELEPNMAVFVQALQQALPAMPLGVLQLRLALSVGSLLMFTVQMGRTPPVRDPAREEAFLKELVRFTSSGLASAPATQGAELFAPPPPLPPPAARRRKN